MSNIRIIARLDVKSPNLVKGIHLEGLRKLGNPRDFAKKYYNQGIDEIIYMDIVASLYERNSLLDLVRESTQDIFVPITLGGGLRNINDVAAALRAGADKIAINTAAIKDPNLISEIATRFGSQCMVLSIEAKKSAEFGGWEAYFDNGREHSGFGVVEWAKRGEELGAGEILLTSVDQEGTQKGFDVDIIKTVSDAVTIPVIAGGGFGKLSDFKQVVDDAHADAVAIAHAFHYDSFTVNDIREFANENNIAVRKV